METIEKTDLLKAVLVILRETFEGSAEGQPSAYLDRGVGLLNTINGVSAEQASRFVSGTTIAAHTEHAKFYLDRLVEFLNGRVEKVNWDDSWLIETVNDAEWNALKGTVNKTYETVLRCFAGIEKWDQDNIGEAVAMIAHTAYHLGAIRQIAKTSE